MLKITEKLKFVKALILKFQGSLKVPLASSTDTEYNQIHREKQTEKLEE